MKKLRRLLYWTLIYLALLAGMRFLHDPFRLSREGAGSTVKFVYQQF